jgi:hypothetical protein
MRTERELAELVGQLQDRVNELVKDLLAAENRARFYKSLLDDSVTHDPQRPTSYLKQLLTLLGSIGRAAVWPIPGAGREEAARMNPLLDKRGLTESQIQRRVGRGPAGGSSEPALRGSRGDRMAELERLIHGMSADELQEVELAVRNAHHRARTEGSRARPLPADRGSRGLRALPGERDAALQSTLRGMRRTKSE